MGRSASPAETILAMRLCLPPKLGSFSFSGAELNAKVLLPPSVREMMGSDHYRCDLLWHGAKPHRSRIAIEYDSDLCHSGPRSSDHDKDRRNHLEHIGIHVISVTKDQLYSIHGLEGIVAQLARALGKRLRVDSPAFTWRQNNLFEHLVGKSGIMNVPRR